MIPLLYTQLLDDQLMSMRQVLKLVRGTMLDTFSLKGMIRINAMQRYRNAEDRTLRKL